MGCRLVLVLSIRGHIRLTPHERIIFKIMKLKKSGIVSFVKLNRTLENLFKKVTSVVTYGNPNTNTVRKLIIKGLKHHKAKLEKIHNTKFIGKHQIERLLFF